jgi:hypothetical protein
MAKKSPMRLARRLAVTLLAASLCGPALAQKKSSQPRPPDPKVVGEIFACLQDGLPKDWQKTWLVMTETGNEGGERRYDIKYFFAVSTGDDKGQPIVGKCNDEEVGRRIYGFNDNLPTWEQRQWKVARLTILKDRKFELKYDYTGN